MCSVSSAPVNPETIVCKNITGKWNFGLPVSTKGTNSKDLIQVGIKKKNKHPKYFQCRWTTNSALTLLKKKKKIPSEPTCTQFNMYLLSTCYGICTIHHGGYRETEDWSLFLESFQLPGNQLHRCFSKCCKWEQLWEEQRTA